MYLECNETDIFLFFRLATLIENQLMLIPHQLFSVFNVVCLDLSLVLSSSQMLTLGFDFCEEQSQGLRSVVVQQECSFWLKAT